MAVTAQRGPGTPAARNAVEPPPVPPEAEPPFRFPDDLLLIGEYERAKIATGDGGVMIGKSSSGGVFLLDGKRPAAGAMHFDPKEWGEFVAAVKDGQFG